MSTDKNNEHSGNIYDRLLKENAEAIFLQLVEWQLGLRIQSYHVLKDKVSKTIEREMDLLYEVVFEDGQKHVLHIEFQTKSDANMLYRMAEYHGLACGKYKLPIRHIVIYLGKGRLGMSNQLQPNEVFKGFDLLNIYSLNATQLISSQIPEIIVLALLANFNQERTEAILRLIVQRLKAVCHSEADLFKYLAQLTILSRLRKLEDVTSQIIEEMPIIYNIEEDKLYQRGIEQGKIQIIQSLLKDNLLTVEQIASCCQISLESVLKLKTQIDRDDK